MRRWLCGAVIFLAAALPLVAQNIAITVRHAPTINGNGRVEGSVQELLGESVTLNGGATLTQDLLVPGVPTVQTNGSVSWQGVQAGAGAATPTGYTVLLNGSVALRYVRTRTNATAIPSVPAPPTPTGTRSVTINQAGQSAGDWTTLRDLTLNGNVGQVALPAGTYRNFTANGGSGFTLGVAGAAQPAIYSFQSLTLNGQTTINVVGPVILQLANGLNANGQAGVTAHPEWLQIRISNGGVTLNGGATLYGSILAPSGEVKINGQGQLCGTAMCDSFRLNGGGLVKWCNTSAGSGNQVPVAAPQSVSTAEDVAKAITLAATDADGNALTFAVATQSAHGTVSGSGANVTYAPFPNYFGPDSFTFTANDGTVNSQPATVTITVTSVNDAPVAQAQAMSATEDAPALLTLMGTDVDGDALTYSITAVPAHGALSGTAPNLTYTPAPNYNGPDSFVFKVRDGQLDSALATVTINVAPVEDVPVVGPLNIITPEDQWVNIALTGFDADGEPLVFHIASAPQHGVLTGTLPNLVYTPAANYYGPDSFTYYASDPYANSTSATVSITVTPVNDPPVAASLAVVTDEDTATAFTLPASDVDGDALTYQITAAPMHGTISGIAPNLLYTPAPNFFGTDSLTFVAHDATSASAPAVIGFTVRAVNDAPAANPQAVALNEDTPATVLLTATEVDGDPLHFTVLTQPLHGTLAATANPAAFLYTPAANYNGSDSFTFKANDGTVDSAPATVTLAIAPVRDVPIAQPFAFATPEDHPAAVTLTGIDYDGLDLTFTIIQPPAHGTLTGSGAERTYTPAHDYNGPDSFRYVAGDSFGDSSPATVPITVTPVNDAPVAAAQSLNIAEDTIADITLAATDVENDTLTFRVVTQPAHGTLTPSASGATVHYSPFSNYNGPDGFAFVANDGQLDSAAATVAIAVTPRNDAPVAQPATFTTREDTSLAIALQGSDVDGDTLTFAPTAPAHGSLAHGALPGTYLYTPVADYHGPDAFTFTVNDGLASSVPAAVSLEITPVNDPPTIQVTAPAQVIAPTAITLHTIATDDGDPVGSVLTVTWSKVSGPGDVAFTNAASADTTASYTLAGTYVLRATASDGELSASADATVVVAMPNQSPDVSAGVTQTVAPAAPANLLGTVHDDGLPQGGTITQQWSKLSGPGTVAFGHATALASTATFSAPGDYVLRLRASDSALSGQAEVTIHVLAPNQPPQVSAGLAQSTVLGTAATLTGSATDDGLPRGAGLQTQWSKVSGPGSVTFADPFATATTAQFSATGLYTLRLTASDSVLTASADVQVTVTVPVNRAPLVDAGPDRSTNGSRSTLLQGTATDDGQPAGSTLALVWSKVTGPGAVTFSDPQNATSGASFSAAGSYVLRLAATDGDLVASDDVTVIVTVENQPPTVSAGPDRTVTLPNSVTLAGRVQDDGLPAGAVLAADWSKVSGPGAVTFAVPTAAQTTANFAQAGSYVLRLHASDGALEAADEVTVTVAAMGVENQPPVVEAGPDQVIQLRASYASQPPGPPVKVPLREISTGLNNAIGIDYHEPTHQVLMSLNYPGGEPSNFVLVDANGAHTPFSNIHGLTEELKIATARDAGGGRSLGGFRAGEMFTGTGVPGHIIRVSPDGSTAQNPWVVLPGETGLLRGSLHVDTTGVFGGDLIVVTTAGGVWRVNAAGVPARLATIPTHLEGLTTIPDMPGRYGPWAGKILIGAELVGKIFAVDAAGHVDAYPLGLNPEDIDIVEPHENFFLVHYARGKLLGASAADFKTMVGDIMVLEENGGALWNLRWTGSSFRKFLVAQVPGGGVEHMTFAGAGIVEIAPPTVTPVAALAGTVTDDGLPASGALTSVWSLVSGPGPVLFDQPDAPATAVNLGQPGSFVLRLTANDSALSAADTLTVTVLPPNRPPEVSAGPDLAAPAVTSTVTLNGFVSDDGASAAVPLAIEWSVADGPGTATFANAHAAATTAVFSAPGIYVLKLSANDGSESASDVAVVRVATPCHVESPAGTVAWWPGNGDGTDATGGGHPVLFEGGVSFVPGKVSLGMRFDGTDGDGLVPAAAALDVGAGAGLTIELWVKPEDDRFAPLVEWHDGVRYGVHLYQNYGAPFINLVDTNGGNHFVGFGGGFFVPGQWQHIAVTYDQASGVCRAWRNGAIWTELNLGSFTPRTVGDLFLSHDPGQPTAHFKGVMDEVAIYNRALTTEIGDLYVAGPTGRCPIDPNEPPFVDAGPNRAVATTGQSAALQGYISDDGRPLGAVTSLWSTVAGPGTVAFADAQAAVTTASFSTPGLYLLKLTASDGADSADDLVEVRVAADCTVEVPEGAVAWWPANGHSRDVIAGNDLELFSGVGYAAGRSLLAFDFDGVNDYAFRRRTSTLNVGAGAGLTIELWVKPEEERFAPLVEWYDGVRYGVHLYQNYGAPFISLVDTNGGNHFVGLGGGFFVPGQWQHIAVTYDQASGVFRAWRNGEIWTEINLGSFTPRTTGDLYLSRDPGQPAAFFKGQLDEITIYRRALTTEITDIFAAGAFAKCPFDQNEHPVPNAGPDVAVNSLAQPAALHGSATDDGLPNGVLNFAWSMASGPGSVTFAEASAADTTALFSAPGLYVLRLTASDGAASRSDLAEVRVAAPCDVEAPDGAVAWWTANGHARDVIGGHDAQLFSGIGYTAGEVSQAFLFDGSNDYAAIPAAASLDLGAGAGLTIELWVKPADDRFAPLVEWHDGVRYGVHLYQNYGAPFINLVDTNGGNHFVGFGGGFFVPGQWQHIAVTYDQASGVFRAWRNGALWTEAYLGSFTPRTASTLYFSRDPGQPTAHFKGALDEIALYNRALDGDELAAIFAAGVVGKCPPDGNRHPFVDAGPNLDVETVATTAQLHGFAADDGLPAGNTLYLHWSVESGAGLVTFANADAAETTATFSAPGIYLLKLTASDGAAIVADSTLVRVGGACTPAAAGLVGWWAGENSGAEFVGGRDAQLLNGTSFGPAQVGQGFVLDGVDDFARVPAAAALNVGAGAGLSLEFWINPTDTRVTPLFEWNDGGYQAHFWMSFNSPTSAFINLIDTAGGHHPFNTPPNLFAAGQWQHIVFSYDKASGHFITYRNGALFSDQFIGSFSPRTTADFYFGHRPGVGVTFAGGLDEVSLYNRALTAAEIATAFSSTGKCLPAAPNRAPYVEAGRALAVALPASLPLSAVTWNDGLPLGGTLALQWAQVSGPGAVTFAPPDAAATSASFTAPGIYVLRLTASDSALTSHDDVTVTVSASGSNLAPLVSAGPAISISLPAAAALAGSVTDDGRPAGTLTAHWAMTEGPASVTFDDANSAATLAHFTSPGRYVLRLTGDDGQYLVRATTTVTVAPPAPNNLPPVVDAGVEQTTTLDRGAVLLARYTDDGVPVGLVPSYQWSVVSGAGSVTFTAPQSLATHASFGASGSYVLRFTGSDTALAGHADVRIEVLPSANAAPVVAAGADFTANVASAATLGGVVTDDGQPAGTLASAWSKVSGPGNVGFANAVSAFTSATFSEPGSYVLKLTATDGALTASATVRVTVITGTNLPPVVNLGADQTVAFGQTATVTPSVDDDGLPTGSVTLSYLQTAGPRPFGAVPNGSGGYTLSFPAVGSYTLRLTANDGQFSTSDEVTFTVTPAATAPPVVQITAPAGGANFARGQTVTLQATASDPDAGGGIVSVAFYDGATLLGTDSAPDAAGHAQFLWMGAAVGSHSLTARATDVSGTTAASTAATITVTPARPNVALSYPVAYSAFAPGDAVQVQATASPGGDGSALTQVEFLVNGSVIGVDPSAPFAAGWTAPAAPGDYTLTARATDTAGQTATSGSVLVRVVTDPSAPLVVELDLAQDGATITAPTPLYGTVSGPTLVSWKVEYRREGSDCGEWVTLAAGAQSVAPGGLLGTLDPTKLLNGIYDVRLTARDAFGGLVASAERVVVEGGMKVGHFTVAFADLQVSLAGLPLTVTRMYDSRERCPGDFGNGWKLDVDSIRLEKSHALGEAWSLGVTVGNLSTPSTYQLTDDGPHLLTVRMPDGEVLRFAPKLVMSRAYSRLASLLDGDGDDVGQAWLPIQYGQPLRLLYRPRGGTKGATLAARGYRASDPFTGAGGTVAGDAPLYVSEPYEGPIALATHENSAQDAPLLSDATGWELTAKDGRKFRFDATGRLEQMRDPQGNVLAILRDGSGRIQKVTHSSGKEITFVRNADGFITAAIDPAGHRCRYSYDAAGDLRAYYDRVTDPATQAGTQQFSYTAGTHYLTDLFDGKGVRAARNDYNADGRLVRTTDAKGRMTSYTHNIAGRTETVTRPLGQVETMQYDDRGNVLRRTNALGEATRFAYDANNYLIKQTDPLNRETTFTYDVTGNILSVVRPHRPAESVADFTTSYTYDQFGHLLSTSSAGGAVEYRSYDARGNILAITDESGQTVASWTYDAQSNQTSEGDAFGATHFAYNGPGNLTKITDAGGQVTTTEFDANQQITAFTRRGVRSTFNYDAEGRETTADYGLGITSSFEHEATNGQWTAASGPTLGRVERTFDLDGKVKQWKSPGGSTTSFDYDAAGRLQVETDALGARSQLTYDAAGRVKQVTNLETGGTVKTDFDAAGEPVKITDALGHASTLTYTPDGRIESATNARGFTWQYRYTPTSITTIDPLGRERLATFTAHGLATFDSGGCCGQGAATETTYLLNSGDDAEQMPLTITDVGGHIRHFGYDAQGLLATATDLGGQTYAFGYDQEFRLQQVTLPSSQPALSFTYDLLDNPAMLTYGDGGTRIFTYGADNRVATEKLPAGPTVTYAYDAEGRIASRTATNGENAAMTYNAANAPLTVTDPAGTSTYEYEARGLLKKLVSPNGGSVEYLYEINGRVAQVSARASASAAPYITAYHYDPAGNVDQITDPLGGVTTLEYDAANRLLQRTLPNAVVTAYTYDEHDRILSVLHRRADQSILASATYERQGLGEPSRITREDGTYVLLGYDGTHRIASEEYHNAAGGLIERVAYQYDADGNRTSLTDAHGSTAYHYQPGGRLTSVDGPGNEDETIAYDTGGRVRTVTGLGASLTLGYNNADQLSAVADTVTGYAETFVHDALGRRVKAVRSTGQERRFLVAPLAGSDLDSPHLVTDAANQPRAAYVYLGASPLMRIGPDGAPEYYLTDGLGSVIGLANAAAAPVARFHYDGFGNLRQQTGTPAATPGGDFRFHGAWREDATGFYHLRARDYDPLTGRFLSRDPEEFDPKAPESIQPYTFANANPFFYSDPTGRASLTEVQTSTAVNNIITAIKGVAVRQAREYAIEQLSNYAFQFALKEMDAIFPNASEFLGLERIQDFAKAGTELEKKIQKGLCSAFGNPTWLYFEPGISQAGVPVSSGYGCGGSHSGRRVFETYYPDIIVGLRPPFDATLKRTNKGAAAIEIKLATNTFYRAYVSPHTRLKQFRAIVGYSQKYSYTRTALFLSVFKGGAGGGKSKESALDKFLTRESMKNGVILVHESLF